MADAPRGASLSKWDQAIPALDEVIATTQDQILWGLKLFPNGSQTCGSADGIDVPLQLNNSAAVINSYKTAGPLGDCSELQAPRPDHLHSRTVENDRARV